MWIPGVVFEVRSNWATSFLSFLLFKLTLVNAHKNAAYSLHTHCSYLKRWWKGWWNVWCWMRMTTWLTAKTLENIALVLTIFFFFWGWVKMMRGRRQRGRRQAVHYHFFSPTGPFWKNFLMFICCYELVSLGI